MKNNIKTQKINKQEAIKSIITQSTKNGQLEV